MNMGNLKIIIYTMIIIFIGITFNKHTHIKKYDRSSNI